MINSVMLIWTFGFFAIMHEFIHWITLKYYGMDGNLGIFWWHKIPNPCLHISYQQNFIRAKQLRRVMLMPYFFGWMWFIPYLMFSNPFTYVEYIMALIIWVTVSSHDIKQSRHYTKWWKLNERVYPINAY